MGCKWGKYECTSPEFAPINNGVCSFSANQEDCPEYEEEEEEGGL